MIFTTTQSSLFRAEKQGNIKWEINIPSDLLWPSRSKQPRRACARPSFNSLKNKSVVGTNNADYKRGLWRANPKKWGEEKRRLGREVYGRARGRRGERVKVENHDARSLEAPRERGFTRGSSPGHRGKREGPAAPVPGPGWSLLRFTCFFKNVHITGPSAQLQ